MPAPDFIAPPDSLLGLLQRGRGEGYRRALLASKSEVHDFLIQCITLDPRMDSQVESRDLYYASIAMEVGLRLEPLAEHLRANDDPSQGSRSTPLTVTTLAELAKRGYRNALDILCDYIGWGQWWDWPLDDLLQLPDADLPVRIARAVEKHFPTDVAMDEAMTSWPAEQFAHLARFSPRMRVSLAKVLPARASRTDEDIPGLDSLSPRELVSLANKDNFRKLGKAIADAVKPLDADMLVLQVSVLAPFAAHVALAGLAKLAPSGLSSWLAEFWLTIHENGDPRRPPRDFGRIIFGSPPHGS